MDRIVVPGIPLMAHLGVTAEEREERQEVVVSLVLHRDLSAAGTSDDLAKTVDYDAVCATVERVVTAHPFHLIEAVAEEVARGVLQGFDVEEVEVRVEKPGALRSWRVPFASVEISRRRDG